MSQYNNATRSTGINITEATPIDDRLHFATLADLLNSILVQPSAVLPVLHDGMVINIKDSRKSYIWMESAYGVLGQGHTYAPYETDVRGQNYANKTYNLVLFDKVVKYKAKFTDIGAAGLPIMKNDLPEGALKDLSSIVIHFQSSWDQFKTIQFPSHIDIGTDDITIILDPKPDLNEEFNITLS